jgi:very-short-patch-repair endonuclease
MFDEASQLKLEDNLPALLKGKQIIIAGDEHQMPPSNYFSKIFDGTIEDEDEIEDEENVKVDRDNILLTCESLLDFASELSFEKKYLDFHYRSKHPFLIDFSNHAFYNKRLKPLPNNFDYIPIKYINVNGTYSDHSNQAEADAVLSIIENNIHRLPNNEYPSVGIATFNIAQRNLIKSKIIERRKFSKFKEFNDKVYELEENGLFVKNLENIQGDERDVIILSTTYGINKDGKFAQRFGPINHKKGYKLLNVIITRAKYKVYVCSSIPEEVFLNFNQHLQTEGANNRRGVFFAYLTYAKAISEEDNDLKLNVLNSLSENTTQATSVDIFNADLESPFEEEVYHELIQYFDSNKIIPQVQFAGFRIDLVYDSKIKGIPKIAIECDGASYHSSREAYLYDLHRQNILEEYGFVFHRIWSTSWWRNPKREMKLLVEFIKKNEADIPKPFNDNLKTAEAFTDNIGSIENYTNNS